MKFVTGVFPDSYGGGIEFLPGIAGIVVKLSFLKKILRFVQNAEARI